MKFVLCIALAYLLGSIPSGVWIGKIAKGIDIREHGSKNSGATNSYRILGAKYGIAVLIADALKGAIAVGLGNAIGLTAGQLAIVGFTAILGHSFSCFLKFKGGKGVATSLGVFLCLEPKVVLVLVILFLGIVFLTRYISLGSIIVAFLLPVLTIVAELSKEGTINWCLIGITVALGAFVIYRHRSNIQRLLAGRENKFTL